MHTIVNYDFHLIQNKQVINQSRCRIWIKTGLIEWHRLDETSDSLSMSDLEKGDTDIYKY